MIIRLTKYCARLAVPAAISLASGCSFPGVGIQASDVVDRFVGTRFTNPANPKFNPQARTYYSSVARGETWIYKVQKEEQGTRYYIDFDYERCLYSLFVGPDDIVRSWRDEHGKDRMDRCAVR